MSNILVRSSTYGYVVENFLALPVQKLGDPNYGKVLPYFTRNGRYAIFPDLASVPPKWRAYAREATDRQAANGFPMPRIVHIRREEEMAGVTRNNPVLKGL